MAAERRRPYINVKRLVMWGLLTDDETATTYDAEPYVFSKSLMSAKCTPAVQTAELYGDGIKVEDYVAKDGGELDIAVTGFENGDGVFLFGETKTEDGTEVSSSADIVPYRCVAYMTERSDGKVNLYKYPKVKFMPQAEDANQREGSKISYGTSQLKGTYSPLISTEADRYRHLGADPVTDAEFITKWFTEANFYTADNAENGE